MTNLEKYLDIQPEIKAALDARKPVVALESTILSHGMPYPENLDFAAKVEQVVRDNGAVPATMAIIGGKLKVGLNEADLAVMCRAENVGKVSRRDVPVYIANGHTGATTVATTMLIAEMAASMQGMDTIAFTAGTGEGSSEIRYKVCDLLGWLGVKIDPELNEIQSDDARVISAPDSAVKVLVVPTNEELMIALDVEALLG